VRVASTAVFLIVTPCRLVSSNERFGRKHRLHLQESTSLPPLKPQISDGSCVVLFSATSCDKFLCRIFKVSVDGATLCVIFVYFPSSRRIKNRNVKELGSTSFELVSNWSSFETSSTMGSKRLGFVLLLPEDGNKTNFRNVVAFNKSRRWTKFKRK
jgi:hypothetical protein